MANPFFTVGHSTRSIEEFVALLRAAQVGTVVDVRKMPRSRTNPQFNSDALPHSLSGAEIGYRHIAELGGLRGRQSRAGSSPNTFWENASFRNYADYALTPGFRAGLDRLVDLGRSDRCAIMCAEALWWRCHRRIISDYLLAAGASVFHIFAPDKIEAAALTSAARLQSDGGIVYSLDGGAHVQ